MPHQAHERWQDPLGSSGFVWIYLVPLRMGHPLWKSSTGTARPTTWKYQMGLKKPEKVKWPWNCTIWKQACVILDLFLCLLHGIPLTGTDALIPRCPFSSLWRSQCGFQGEQPTNLLGPGWHTKLPWYPWSSAFDLSEISAKGPKWVFFIQLKLAWYGLPCATT